MKIVNSPGEAIASICSGQRIFVHGCMATPCHLLHALFNQANRLKDIELIHLHLHGDLPYCEATFTDHFKVANLFVGPNVRNLLDYDRIDYLPCFLSEIPGLINSNIRPVNVALIQVSPPDKHGYCSLGTSVDIAVAAVERAELVIAQINSHMPRVHGDGFIPVSKIDYAVEINSPLPELEQCPITPLEEKIGEHVSSLIEDGATLQIGIGGIPNAVLAKLSNHRHLGIHTEMWSDGALDLILSGAVDNSEKKLNQNLTVSSFIAGTKRLYDFIDDNPSVLQLDIGYVNSPEIISQNPKVTAINSAVEVDLTGQICADSIGHKIISGVGGQMDFMRGASSSKGGKAIIALPSRTKFGTPRIVHQLKQGAGVVTTRGHVHYVVTEYGCVNLFGKTLRERADALISIAHPDDRGMLEEARRLSF